jgi:4-amino-4-deoxy-L-arabinose transferase-like glycosyltransferase
MMTTLKISTLWGKSTRWEKISLLSICVLFCASIFFIVSFRGPQISDFARYVQLAKNNIENGTYYPNNENLYDAYIHAPGFVNYLILLFKISTNLRLVYVFNLLWTFVLLFSLRHIISCLFNRYRG